MKNLIMRSMAANEKRYLKMIAEYHSSVIYFILPLPAPLFLLFFSFPLSSSPSDHEKRAINEDLRRKKRRCGVFEKIAEDTWIMGERSPVPHTQTNPCAQLMGEYVRLKNGTVLTHLI